jgi:hypothetical protein
MSAPPFPTITVVIAEGDKTDVLASSASVAVVLPAIETITIDLGNIG